jgi:FixJ family two-component response regulator
VPPSANRSTCFVVDPDPGTRHIVLSVWGGMSVTAEFFESVAAMLERYAVVPPDLILIDVTADSGQARRHLEMLMAAGVDRPIRLMSGLNGLLT